MHRVACKPSHLPLLYKISTAPIVRPSKPTCCILFFLPLQIVLVVLYSLGLCELHVLGQSVLHKIINMKSFLEAGATLSNFAHRVLNSPQDRSLYLTQL